jgi:uncharacterized membrane protein HdeD (DUF308 family)
LFLVTTTTTHTRLGNALIVRAIPTLIAAIVITFSGNHGAALGLAVFVGFAFLVAPVQLLTIALVPLGGVSRTTTGIQAIGTVTAGAIAAATLTGGLPALVLVISIWAAVTAALELYAGYRATDRAIAREWLTLGGFTAVLALVIAVIPMNDVYAVGLFGAYAMISGLFLVIAGISLRAGTPARISPSKEKNA